MINGLGRAGLTGWRWYRRRSSRTQVALAVGLVVVGIVGNLTEPEANVSTTGAPASTTSSTVRTVGSEITESSDSSSTKSVDSGEEPIAVASITDGDTLTVADGRRIRLAQVDAPETGECWGSQATTALRLQTSGQLVVLRRPPSAPVTDRYGRTLAEVVVDGVSINELLIREGAAEWYEEFASEDPDLARRLEAAERDGRHAGRGLWSACTARGAPATAAPASTTSTAVVRTTAPPPTSSGERCHSSYTGTCIPPDVEDADCAGGSGNGPWYVKEENIGVVGPDVFDLDRDGDGIGCES